jgi:hypothetical protein
LFVPFYGSGPVICRSYRRLFWIQDSAIDLSIGGSVFCNRCWCGFIGKGSAASSMAFEACVLPQSLRNNDRIKLNGFPPCCLVATAMEDTMVRAAEGNRKLIADSAPQRARLGKSQVMGIRRPASAQKARLRCHKLQVCAITVAARFAELCGNLGDDV